MTIERFKELLREGGVHPDYDQYIIQSIPPWMTFSDVTEEMVRENNAHMDPRFRSPMTPEVRAKFESGEFYVD